MKVTAAQARREARQVVGQGSKAGKSGFTPRLFVSSGVPQIDAASGRGGIPTSRIVVFTGGPSMGKTGGALLLAAEFQALGGMVKWYDGERTLEEGYAVPLGVDWEDLTIWPSEEDEERIAEAIKGARAKKQPKGEDDDAPPAKGKKPEKAKKKDKNAPPPSPRWLEEILEDVYRITMTAAEKCPDLPILLVVDTVNMILTKEETLGGFHDEFIASKATAFSNYLPKLLGPLRRSSVCLLLISQVRDALGVTKKVSGGNAVRHNASVVVDFGVNGFVKTGDDPVGSKARVKFSKNKLAVPFREAEYEVRWGKGPDVMQSYLDFGCHFGLVVDCGQGWYEFDVQLPSGKESFRVQKVWGPRHGAARLFSERPEVWAALKHSIRCAAGWAVAAKLAPAPEPPAPASEPKGTKTAGKKPAKKTPPKKGAKKGKSDGERAGREAGIGDRVEAGEEEAGAEAGVQEGEGGSDGDATGPAGGEAEAGAQAEGDRGAGGE